MGEFRNVQPLLDRPHAHGKLVAKITRLGLSHSRQPQMLARITVRDLETGNEQEILRMADQRLIGFLALSPDGNRLAFTVWRLQGAVPRNTTLTLMPASGGQATELFQVEFEIWAMKGLLAAASPE